MTTALEVTIFPDQVVSEGVALLASGYSLRRVERELRALYPDDAPSRETIRRWDQAYAAVCHEETETREQRLIAVADDIMADAIKFIGEDPTGKRASDKLIALNAFRGTMADKQIRRSQSGTGNVQVNVILEVRERLRQELEGRATLVIDSPDTQNDPDITPGP